MQTIDLKVKFGAILLVFALMVGGTAISLAPAQAEEGLNQVFLPSVIGEQSALNADINAQQESEPEIAAAHDDHDDHKSCKVRAKGLEITESEFSVAETVERVKAEIAARPLNLIKEIDHAANADSVGEELRPTTLLIFGNPAVGTPLMQSNQTIAIDLPQKFLVWEDECGTVRIGYNDPSYLRKRHRIRDRDENFDNISNVLATIAHEAAVDH